MRAKLGEIKDQIQRRMTVLTGVVKSKAPTGSAITHEWNDCSIYAGSRETRSLATRPKATEPFYDWVRSLRLLGQGRTTAGRIWR
jgi:hypothetical protein